MGKNSKFRCLFGIKRNNNNASPPALDKKLSRSKLLEKCPAKPNQYFQGGRSQTLTEDKSEKFGTNKTPEIIQTQNQENPEQNDKIAVEKDTKTIEVKAIVAAIPKVVISPEEMNQKLNGRSKNEKVEDIRRFRNEDISKTHLMNHDDRAYEKLTEPKRHHDEVTSGKVTDSIHRDRAKIYKKEFVRQNCDNSRYQTTSLDRYENASNFQQNDFIKLQPNATSSDHSFDSITTFSSLQRHQHFDEPQKEWGWVTNPTKNNPHEQLESISISRYVNDESRHLCTKNTSSNEVSFTITEKSGKSLHFTIVGNGTGVAVPQLHPSEDINHNSKTEPQDFITSHRRWISGNASTSRDFDRIVITNNVPTRTMGYPESPPTHTMHPGPSKKILQYKHQNGSQKDLVKTTTSSNPHFELSMASYSRLIAYTNKSSTRGKSHTTQNRLSRQSSNISEQPSHSGTRVQETPEVNDLCRLAKVFETVEECPWYWGAITGQEAGNILRGAESGSFLLRDSSDSKHLFSLSMKTNQGPTSIRIVYTDGTFRFDSEMDDTSSQRSTRSDHPNYVKKITPVFTCVVKMILYYSKHLIIEKSKAKNSTKNKNNQCERCSRHQHARNSSSDDDKRISINETDVHKPEQFLCYWVSRHGRQGIPVVLSKPIPNKRYFPTLQSLCRKTVSNSQKLYANERLADDLPLPNSLKKYLKKYPYPV